MCWASGGSPKQSLGAAGAERTRIPRAGGRGTGWGRGLGSGGRRGAAPKSRGPRGAFFSWNRLVRPRSLGRDLGPGDSEVRLWESGEGVRRSSFLFFAQGPFWPPVPKSVGGTSVAGIASPATALGTPDPREIGRDITRTPASPPHCLDSGARLPEPPEAGCAGDPGGARVWSAVPPTGRIQRELKGAWPLPGEGTQGRRRWRRLVHGVPGAARAEPTL